MTQIELNPILVLMYICQINLQARQQNDASKYRTAEIKFTVEPSNQNAPVVTTNTGGTTGYVYEGQNSGEVVRSSASTPPPAALEIIVTDPDVVCLQASFIYSICSDLDKS